MNQSSHKNFNLLLFILYALLIAERLYGIHFLRWAFDEEQNFGGGTAILKWTFNLFGANISNPEMEHLVSIYGIVGKYLAVLPAALGFTLERVFSIDLSIPLGLIFTRVFVSFLPSILTIYLIHKIVCLISDNKVFLVAALGLFLITFKHIETAHYGVSDALSTFFAVLSFYYYLQFSLQTIPKKASKYLALTTIACMLTISTKINVGLVMTASIGLLLVLKDWKTEIGRKNIQIFALTAIGAFVVINLPYLVQFEEWSGEIIRHLKEYSYTIRGSFLTPFYFHPPFGLGTPILLAAFGGMYYGARLVIIGFELQKGRVRPVIKRTVSDDVFLLPLLFLVSFYIYLAFSRGVIHRWAIPMTPFFVLFAAYLISLSYHWCSALPSKFKTFFSIFFILVFLGMGITPLSHIFQFNLALTTEPNSYEQLQKFVNQQVTENNCICNIEGVLLKNCSENAPESIDALKESSIEYIVFSDFWFSERRYPLSILYLEVIDKRTHGNWRTIRQYLEGEQNDWKLEQVIQPKHYTYWSTNIAQPPIFYIYKRI